MNEYHIKTIGYCYKMLFRTSNGQLIELKQNAYVNDKVYYEKLMEVHRPLPKLDNEATHKYDH